MPNYSTRVSTTKIRLIIIHTNQGPNPPDKLPDRTAENLASYLTSTANTSNPVSYHVLVDDDSLVNYLSDDRVAYSARDANPISLNLCFTGYAEWNREEWLKHPNMLRMAAQKVREWCDKYKIPKNKITPQNIVDIHHGIIGHNDWTLSRKLLNRLTKDSHWDPGPGFPWDVFIKSIQEGEGDSEVSTTVENHFVLGDGFLCLGLSTGKASGAGVKEAWVSAFSKGPAGGRVRLWFQNDSAGISVFPNDKELADIEFKDGRSSRKVSRVPDGTTMVRVEYLFMTGGTITVETKS